MIEDIKTLLKSLPGVESVVRLKKEHIPDILQAESRYAGAHVVKVSNLGLHKVLERETVFVVSKNHDFRKPPAPTLYLVEDPAASEIKADGAADHFLSVNGTWFRIVGEEYFPWAPVYRENHRILDNGMVLFPDRISTNPRREAYFLLPPITFPEVEESEYAGRLANIMSVSPSAGTDDLVRRLYRLQKGAEYATLFVGFDTCHE